MWTRLDDSPWDPDISQCVQCCKLTFRPPFSLRGSSGAAPDHAAQREGMVLLEMALDRAVEEGADAVAVSRRRASHEDV